MDQRIESFLADVPALAGEDLDAVRERGAGRPRQVRGDLPAAGAEEAHEGQAAHACRALCRARVAEELQRRRGTRILALSIIDRQQER
jgi:hypothetical protein